MAYTVLGSSVVVANDPATALAALTVGDNQSVYLILANSAAGGASLTVAGAEAAGALTVPASETYIVGPLQGKNLAEHGLFSGVEAHSVTVTAITAPGNIVVDRRRGGYLSQPPGQVPFIFQPLIPVLPLEVTIAA